MFKKYYVVFLMLLVPIISVSIISNIFDNINNKSVVSEPVKKEIKTEKESNEDSNKSKGEKYKGIDKLMIVAHPDDESFWGGAHLLEDDYLVVCITCGPVKRRVEEFKKAMAITKDEYIMLGYPDVTKGKRDDWSKVHEKIKADLDKIINYKNWKMIVTHNPLGEYGHVHHKMTSGMVTELADKDVLYYFGYYVSKGDTKNIEGMPTISSESQKNKIKKLIPIYVSQINAQNDFKHMFNYENFVFNKDWNPDV